MREYHTHNGRADLDSLPEPTDLAEDIIENIKSGPANFRTVAATLARGN